MFFELLSICKEADTCCSFDTDSLGQIPVKTIFLLIYIVNKAGQAYIIIKGYVIGRTAFKYAKLPC